MPRNSQRKPCMDLDGAFNPKVREGFYGDVMVKACIVMY